MHWFQLPAGSETIFASTHALEVVQAVDDIRKAQTYDYPELGEFSMAERKVLLREWRESAMDWFYFTPKAEIKT